MELKNFSPFIGDHCETVATGTLLKHVGIDLPESVIFGLGQGLSFIFLNLSSLPLPFVGGRVKPVSSKRFSENHRWLAVNSFFKNQRRCSLGFWSSVLANSANPS
ncbi:MAG: BtrH N-terminal domain-containing protein [Gammaproteobacteria bacterium]|nr:BtrH N-terminal domain-containing protein [Gammaproteobacteria bacterium]